MTEQKRYWFVECDDYSIGPYKSREAAEDDIKHMSCRNEHTITEVMSVKPLGPKKGTPKQ